MVFGIHTTFQDRSDAGKKLAELLMEYKGKEAVVFALTRGGVSVGKEVARGLGCSLEALVIKKLGHPDNPEYAVGAVAVDGSVVLNEAETGRLDAEWLKNEIEKKRKEAEERQRFLGGAGSVGELTNKIAIIVDDGIATGLTMQAAILQVKKRKPKKVVVAVPVSPADTKKILEKRVDDFVAVSVPLIFMGAIGAYYEHFDQVSDEEVKALLTQA